MPNSASNIDYMLSNSLCRDWALSMCFPPQRQFVFPGKLDRYGLSLASAATPLFLLDYWMGVDIYIVRSTEQSRMVNPILPYG